MLFRSEGKLAREERDRLRKELADLTRQRAPDVETLMRELSNRDFEFRRQQAMRRNAWREEPFGLDPTVRARNDFRLTMKRKRLEALEKLIGKNLTEKVKNKKKKMKKDKKKESLVTKKK